MYLLRANYVFTDNSFTAPAIGQKCSIDAAPDELRRPTIGDLLDTAGVSVDLLRRGLPGDGRRAEERLCPKAPTDCDFGVEPLSVRVRPRRLPVRLLRDASATSPTTCATTRSSSRPRQQHAAAGRVRSRARLPLRAPRRRHADLRRRRSSSRTRSILSRALAPTQKDTLVLVTWDEGGGYFDHIAPPGMGTDNQPYGTRIPLLALGPFAKANAISHVAARAQLDRQVHRVELDRPDRPARGARCRGRKPRDPARSGRDRNTSAGIAVCSAREANKPVYSAGPRRQLSAQPEQARRHEVGLGDDDRPEDDDRLGRRRHGPGGGHRLARYPQPHGDGRRGQRQARADRLEGARCRSTAGRSIRARKDRTNADAAKLAQDIAAQAQGRSRRDRRRS